MPAVDADRAAELRRALADLLTAPAGPLRSPAWRAALEQVPRHDFVRGFFRPVGEQRWEPVTPQRVGERAWLELVYTDTTLITQLDFQHDAEHTPEPVCGDPTSSSNLPSLVIGNYEALRVRRGHRVLEIGTGTGWATALLAHRLGNAGVTTVELDAGLAAKAAIALRRNGFSPQVVVGDGLAGHPDGAPYDRITTTFAVRRIPDAWPAQVRRGGIIVTAIEGWLGTALPVRLSVTDRWNADGEFLPCAIPLVTADAMTARSQVRSPAVIAEFLNRAAEAERPTEFGPNCLLDPAKGLIARCVVPHAKLFTRITESGSWSYSYLDPLSGSCAVLRTETDGWVVRQGGSQRLWDTIERALGEWRAVGAPDVTRFRMRYSAGEKSEVYLPGTRLAWALS